MTRKELCKMCTEYASDVKCENKKTCKLQAILTENARLKAENTELRKANNEMRIRASWEKYPDMMGK